MKKEEHHIKVNTEMEFTKTFTKHINEVLPNIEQAVFIGVGGNSFYFLNGTNDKEQMSFLFATSMLQDSEFKEAIKLAIRIYNREKVDNAVDKADGHISEVLAKVIKELLNESNKRR